MVRLCPVFLQRISPGRPRFFGIMQQIQELEGMPKRASNARDTRPHDIETYFEVEGVNDATEPQGTARMSFHKAAMDS
jgi:hypothetical protein